MTSIASEFVAPKNLAEQKPKLVAASRIKPSRPEASRRTFSRKNAQDIADSVRALGLLAPITVRPIEGPEESREYDFEIVYGVHRFHACTQILGWTEIPAYVEKLDDVQASVMSAIENVCRAPLSSEQYFEQLKEWRQWSVENAPTRAEAARRVRRAGDAAARQAVSRGATPDEIEEAREGAAVQAREEARAQRTAAAPSELATGPKLAESIAAATGKSRMTVYRDLKATSLLSSLDEEEKAIVWPDDESARPRKQHLDILARFPTEARAAAIKLRGSGMEWGEALDHAAERYVRPRDPGAPPDIDDLDDDEYIKVTCPRMEGLRKKTVFKPEVRLYRRFDRLRKKFAKDLEAILGEARDSGHRGPLYYWIEQAFRVRHPNDWWICMACDGTGKDPHQEGRGCEECHGAAYRPSAERLK